MNKNLIAKTIKSLGSKVGKIFKEEKKQLNRFKDFKKVTIELEKSLVKNKSLSKKNKLRASKLLQKTRQEISSTKNYLSILTKLEEIRYLVFFDNNKTND